MIRAACQIGAILAGGTEEQIEAAGKYAYALGMAFQIRDDMLDCTGTQDKLGKPIGSDVEKGERVHSLRYMDSNSVRHWWRRKQSVPLWR